MIRLKDGLFDPVTRWIGDYDVRGSDQPQPRAHARLGLGAKPPEAASKPEAGLLKRLHKRKKQDDVDDDEDDTEDSRFAQLESSRQKRATPFKRGKKRR